jgi:UDP-N-acetylglucosamine--N-acetylmuramyl-(pentapeptide) pyrophosphoryl-undecaprenol N-acetylglucosamine transferase
VPFIENMPEAIAAADLVVGRSGASAVSEICAIGRASLLVPYPHAASDHQWHNAKSLEAAGAALAVRANQVSVQGLARDIERLVGSPETLAKMAEAARELGRPEAAKTVASDLLRVSKRPARAAAFQADPGANRPTSGPMTFQRVAEVRDV